MVRARAHGTMRPCRSDGLTLRALHHVALVSDDRTSRRRGDGGGGGDEFPQAACAISLHSHSRGQSLDTFGSSHKVIILGLLLSPDYHVEAPT